MSRAENRHGGRRKGAGRPKGSRMRRSEELAEKLIGAGKCPAEALIRLAEQAEAEGDIAHAISAWKSLVPYIYPKPKAVEIAPDEIVELTRALAIARAQGLHSEVSEDHVALLEKFRRELENGQSLQ